MSQTNFLIDSLVACEKHEFDKVVKVYLKEVYDFKRVGITDGTDDTGIDLRVFDHGSEKIQYQLTIQKSAIKSKILSDLEKAEENHRNYNFSKNLFFFYSKPLTNKFKREITRDALSKFGINLTIIEAKQIAEEAEEYLELTRVIIETNQVMQFVTNQAIFPESEKNLIFDLVSFGKPSDFRMQIVESFVLQEVLKSQALGNKQIIDLCKAKFGGNETDIFYDKLITRLKTTKKLKNDLQGNLSLTTEESDRLKHLKQKYDLSEKRFLDSINLILSKYQQDQFLDEYVIQLKKTYIKNFNSDIVDLVKNLKTNDLSGLSRDFMNFVKSKISGSDNQIKDLAIELFECCGKDDFLKKFCAGKVFSDKTNLSKIEAYATTQKRVFIDTQIAIYSLCVYYNPRLGTYTDYFFNTTKSLITFCDQNNIPLNLPIRYLWEVQGHIRDAFNLVPLTHLPNFTKLGRSKNVFYNYFLHLQSQDDTDEMPFDNFLGEFGFRQRDSNKTHNQVIEKHLKHIGIKIQYLEYEYDIEDTSKMIQMNLMRNDKFKTKFTLENDAIMMEFLSDDDTDVHPLQPIFLSWDKTFFNTQGDFFKKNPMYQRWFLMSPGRFIDQYSLLKFSINSEALSSEMIAYLSDDIIGSTHELVDSIAFLSSDEVGLTYVNRLAEMRDNEIHRIQDKQLSPPQHIEGRAAIDDIFYKLTNHYQNNNFDGFKMVFKKWDLIDLVIGVIKAAVEEFYEKRKLNEQGIIKKFDSLISQVSEDAKTN